MPFSDTSLFAFLFLFLLAGCAFFAGESEWVLLTHRADSYAFTLKHPGSWSVEGDRNTTVFRPPGTEIGDGKIELVVFNPSKTPPLGVDVTYTTIRVVSAADREVLVQKRDPAPVTERYVAIVREGDWVVEFRCFLDAAADTTFDRMVGSFTFVSP